MSMSALPICHAARCAIRAPSVVVRAAGDHGVVVPSWAGDPAEPRMGELGTPDVRAQPITCKARRGIGSRA